MRRLFLGLATCLCVLAREGGAQSQPPPAAAAATSAKVPELEAAIRALVHDRVLKDAQVGVVIMDAETGAVLASSGEHVVMNPASNAKLYTAAAALSILHGTH